MLGEIINSFVVILVGVNLAPSIGNEVQKATTSPTNFSASAVSLIGLIPLFFVLGILAAGIRGAVRSLADIGLM
jgi:hypothetical protein